MNRINAGSLWHFAQASRLRVLALVAAALTAAAVLPAHAAVFTEDFGGGNPANSTDYTLVSTGTSTTQGNYRIVNNPANPTFGNNYGSLFDHTLGTASGSMLFFDGSATNTDRIFYRTASLTAGTLYLFSYWQAADNLGSPPNLEADVNGTAIGSLVNSSSDTWAKFSGSFTPATSGTYTFSIRDLNTVGALNDGAIDDVQLVAVPEPGTAALLGVAAFAMVTRRSRSLLRK